MACNVTEILEDACENKFACLPNQRVYDIVMAQLLCEIKDGIVTLVEALPEG